MVYPEQPEPAAEQPAQDSGIGQPVQEQAADPAQDAAVNPQDHVAGGDLAANVAHAGQQPGQEGSDQPPVHPDAGDVQGRQEAVTAGAPDGPYDEVAAVDQAHAHADPGTIEHEQAKVMAGTDPAAVSSDPRERNQAAEGQAMKERAQDLLAGQEQAARDETGPAGHGETGTAQDGTAP